MNDYNYKQTDEVLRFERELGKEVGAEMAEKVKTIISDLVGRYTTSLIFSYNRKARDERITRRVTELRLEAEKKGDPRNYEDIYEQVGREIGNIPETVKHIFRKIGGYKQGEGLAKN